MPVGLGHLIGGDGVHPSCANQSFLGLYAARLVGWPLGYLVWGGFSKSFKADMTCENLERCFQNNRRRSRIDT